MKDGEEKEKGKVQSEREREREREREIIIKGKRKGMNEHASKRQERQVKQTEEGASEWKD